MSAAAWYLAQLPLACAAAALLELDRAHVGQFMLSRPIVLGPVVGWLCGNLMYGIEAGAIVEALTADEMPVGHVIPLNASVATASAVLLSSGPRPVHWALSLPAGLCLGGVFRLIEGAIRRRRAGLTRKAEAALEGTGRAPLGRLLAAGMGVHALAAAGFVYGAAAVAGPILWSVFRAVPAAVREGFQLAYWMTPWLGAATLAYALRPR